MVQRKSQKPKKVKMSRKQAEFYNSLPQRSAGMKKGKK